MRANEMKLESLVELSLSEANGINDTFQKRSELKFVGRSET